MLNLPLGSVGKCTCVSDLWSSLYGLYGGRFANMACKGTTTEEEWIVAMVEREAHVVWEGDLAQGSGNLSEDSGVLQEAPVSFASRVE